jgi:potassium channel subfamily K
VRDTPEAFRPHSDYIIRAHEAYQDIRRRLDEQRRTRGAAGVHEKRDDGERGVSVIPPGSRSLPVDNVNLSPHNCGPTNGEKGGMGSLRRKTPHENTETQECNDQQTDGGKEDAEEEVVRELESHLLRKLVDLMVRLETEARQMLLDSMGNGLVRTLFLADRNGELQTGQVTSNNKEQRAGTRISA